MPPAVKVRVNEGYAPGAGASPEVKPRKRGDKHSGTTVRQETSHHILLPKIGPVAVMSDDSLHPAMTRSRARAAGAQKQAQATLDATVRKLASARTAHVDAVHAAEAAGGAFGREPRPETAARLASRVTALQDAVRRAEKTVTQVAAAAEGATGSRHMGNRRRARHLIRHLKKTPAKATALAALLRDIRQQAGLTPEQAAAALNRAAGTRAQQAAAAKAAELEHVARRLLDAAGDDRELRKKALVKLRYAQKKSEGAPAVTAARTDRWDAAKLARLETSGIITGGLDQAQVICDAYQLGDQDAARLMPLAAQSRIIRATVSLGADGLWWCSVGAEVPYETRVTRDPETGATRPVPGPKQRAGGLVGVDWGVREIMTVSDGTVVPNPRQLEMALSELRDANRRLSRSQPGSKRREKDRQLTGLIHADIARLRADALHRATTALVRSHDVIAVEGWNVQQVMRDGSKNVPRRVRRDRNRALADTGIGMGREQLKYKGPRNGTTVMVTAPDAGTGRTCCLHKTARTKPLAPGEELFTSDMCGCIRDRRRNTADALAGWAVQELKRGPSSGGPVEPRGGDVRPAAALTGGGGQSPAKRAAGARRGRGETGTPGG
jgi:transposase